MAIQITIIGLGQIGTSIGLALKDHKDLVRRVGHDREPQVAKQAEKMGALDQAAFNLPTAVRQAEVVILAEPIHLARETLRSIAPELKEGAVILDTTPLRHSMEILAEEVLPAERHYVAITPTINPAYLVQDTTGPDSAHADLFKNSLMVVTAPTRTHSEAIKLASDLSTLLGATPFFGDPFEMDGVMASSRILPQLASAALVLATTGQPGWREARRIAGKAYLSVAAPLGDPDSASALGQAARLNQENTLRVLDDYILILEEIRAGIEAEDGAALEEKLEHARQAYTNWWKLRQTGDWERQDIPRPEMPSTGEIFGRLIGLRKRPPISQK